MPHRFPSMADLPHRLRNALAEWPEHWQAWRAQLRDDPALLWRTPLVRAGLWAVLGLLLLIGARWLSNALVPGGGGADVEPTPFAIVYVACTSPECREHASVKVPRDFSDWPMVCPRCGQKTVYRARLCSKCRHWYATAPGRPGECPFCAARKAAQPTREPEAPVEPSNPDDAEDPWD